MFSIGFARCWRVLATVLIISGVGPAHAVTEDISFVAEHLPEVAMDNRYASLPLWAAPRAADANDWRLGAALGYTKMKTGALGMRGPMLDLSVQRQLERWSLTAFVFYDDFSFAGGPDQRPLDQPFVTTPISMPVAAEFAGLGGSMTDVGGGVSLRRHFDDSWIGALDIAAGVLWQSVQLDNYATDYLVLDGPDAGAQGTIDYSATYKHFTPFAGVAESWELGSWIVAPHVQFALPLPRRAMIGRITGPGFDLTGDTETNGAGKHFGDPSVTIGFDVTYLPWHLTFDVGSVVTQALFEPLAHEGIDENWLLQLRWAR